LGTLELGLTTLQTTTSTARSKIGKWARSTDKLVADVKAWIASKDHHFFARGIDRLPHKWEAAIEADVDYPPKWSSDYVLSLLLMIYLNKI
jgi:hypothetical protein